MPLTSYCKKCGRDVPVSDRCPDCGAKLPANAVRLAWCVDHTPVRDWMCWNAVMRIALPVVGMVLLLTLLLEGSLGGLSGLTMLLAGGLLPTLTGLMIGGLALLLLAFILQGDDLLDCVMDASGVHVQQYLLQPSPVKLLMRLRSPSLMAERDESGLILIGSYTIAWKEIRRVQLWPEKTLILFYNPVWWQRLSLPCTPFTWEDALTLIREKIGKKKDVILPPECVQTTPAKVKSARPKKTRQLTIEDIPPQAVTEEPPADWTQEQPGDFTPLGDVLEEIRQSSDL